MIDIFNITNSFNMQDSKKIGEYSIVGKIGEGAFGQIYEVQYNGQTYAIKTETIGNIKPMVVLQYELLRLLQQQQKKSGIGYGFPKVYNYCQKEHFAYMVMEKLDLTLQDLANVQMQNKIQKDVLIIIMYNTLRCLQWLHSLNYLYRDVKPSNFMLKTSELQLNQAKIYLIDLGLCKKFIKKDNSDHIPMRTNKRMIGTPIFCSLNIHKGIECSRRDDVQSWIYMIIYLVKKLPWQIFSVNSLPSQDRVQKMENIEHKQTLYQKIGNIKQSTNVVQMIREQPILPQCLIKILEHIKGLQFEMRPNYELIYRWLQQQYDKITNQKIALRDIPFSLKSKIPLEEQKEQKKKIKINFKIPQGKIKEKKVFDFTSLQDILQK